MLFNMSKNISKELTFNNAAIKSLSFCISFAKVIHIFEKTKFFMLKNLNASYFIIVNVFLMLYIFVFHQ